MANSISNKKDVGKSLSISSVHKTFAHQPLQSITSHKWGIGKRTGGQVAPFLIKTIALEALRRLSKAKCPLIWFGLQGFQVLCVPPFKWIQCWKPFGFLVSGMQMISRPLLVLSIVNAFSDQSDSSDFLLNDNENSPSDGDSQLGSGSHSRSHSQTCNQGMVIGDEHPEGHLSSDWLNQLYRGLENLGIMLPERFNREELQRFYIAANGDMRCLITNLKKTIHWRETYRILSEDELEVWSNLVFWHGLDVKCRPCLIIRLGMSCRLPSHSRPHFIQAIVSQVEYGVLHLVDVENPQITVLVDCQGLSPLRFPMQTMRYCTNLFQDHYPNVLGCLMVIQLPSVVRVIAQTFIQVLKPSTKQKLRIEGETYRKVLSEFLQIVPLYLGGQCTCTKCAKLDSGNILQQASDGQTSSRESIPDIINTDDFVSAPEAYRYESMMDNYCIRSLWAAVISILIIWVLITFVEGIYNPESRPNVPPPSLFNQL